jgi:uncharacterized protein (DUF1778 family)
MTQPKKLGGRRAGSGRKKIAHKRDCELTSLVTADEKALVTATAEVCGESVSEYTRTAVLDRAYSDAIERDSK